MTKDEALRLALEALETKYIVNCGAWRVQQDQAITAIKAALEAKDEPVAWRYDQAKYRTNDLRGRQWAFNVFSQARPYMDEMVQNVTPLYTTPPQRKPLTDEEIHQIFIANSVVVDNGNAYMVAGLRALNITRAIEAAHGIKGEA